MKKMQIIFGSFLIIIFCVSIITGATYALFTSKAEVNIAVHSATVKVSATPTVVATYSITPDKNGDIVVGSDHYSQPATAVLGTFTTSGTASINSDGDVVLDRMVPGDKAVIQVAITNESDVAIKYRLKIEAADADAELIKALVVTIDLDGDAGEQNVYNPVSFDRLISYGSASIDVTPGASIKSATITIEMPATVGNNYQTKSMSFVLTVEAVQGNAASVDESHTQKPVS